MENNKNPHIQFRDEVLNKVSKSFCAAKWLNATIWLNSGMTASCHHPTPHHVKTIDIENNPSGIHNSPQKKFARAQMLNGIRPPECEYCWKIEDLPQNHVSDRVFKSEIYSAEDIQRISKADPLENVNLRTLEVAFDRVCNFACSYCSPHFSTSWAQDIRQNGPYKDLGTDTQNHYISDQPHSDQYKDKENPYITAFWKWWPELRTSLHQLRITGGEPLLSPHVWKILESLNISETPDLKLAINSNLGSPKKMIQKLVELAESVPHLEIYTSNEAFGKQAEFIRDGLEFELWKENCETILSNSGVKALHVMMTINALCLFSITELLDLLVEWKLKYKTSLNFSVNILRFPEFQSPLVLPENLKAQIRENLKKWLATNSSNITDFERSSLLRLVDYLEGVEFGTASASAREKLEVDLKRFLNQYESRRNKSLKSCFPKEAIDWVESI